MSLLEQVRRSLLDEPVFTLDSGRATLVAESLNIDELAPLFLSAGLPVTACLCMRASIVNAESLPA